MFTRVTVSGVPGTAKAPTATSMARPIPAIESRRCERWARPTRAEMASS
jgi:hypothetical protein